MRIAIITAETARNFKQSWGLSNHYITRALERAGHEVITLKPPSSLPVIAGRAYNAFTLKTQNKRYLYCDNWHVARCHRQSITRQLHSLKNIDVVLAPDGTTEISLLDTDIPLVLMEGATVAQWTQYYPYENTQEASKQEAEFLQHLALLRASLVLNPSQWAATSSIQDYHISPEKVHVVPYGANIDTVPSQECIAAKRQSGQCRLLFVGNHWKRKGGDIALETLIALRERGIPATLAVVGCIPPVSHEYMMVFPYLRKDDEEQAEVLSTLFRQSDYFLLPTQTELFGIVFCEAAAYGLPVLAADSGGVSGAVTHGETGFLLPCEARGGAYAELIERLGSDALQYARMVQASREAFETRLNWDVWARRFTELVEGL